MKENRFLRTALCVLRKGLWLQITLADSTLQTCVEQFAESYLDLGPKSRGRLSFPSFCYEEICDSKKVKCYISQTVVTIYESLLGCKRKGLEYGAMLGSLLGISDSTSEVKFDSGLAMNAICFFNLVQKEWISGRRQTRPEHKHSMKTGGEVDAGMLSVRLARWDFLEQNLGLRLRIVAKISVRQCAEGKEREFAVHKIRTSSGGVEGIAMKEEGRCVSWKELDSQVRGLAVEEKKGRIKQLIKESAWTETLLTPCELAAVEDLLCGQAISGPVVGFDRDCGKDGFMISKLEFVGLVAECASDT